MKKLKLLLLALVATISLGAFADAIDVTASYIGDLSRVVNGSGHNCNNNHKMSQGIGFYNTQNLQTNSWHPFVGPGDSGVGESWTSGNGSKGIMMGRMMVLPAGNYTLKFSAFGCTATNATNQTPSSPGDVVAFCTGQTDIDITNTTLGGNTFHDVEFTFDVTTPNTSIEFGIKKVADESYPDWCQIKSIKLYLNSTDISPVANNNVELWNQTFDGSGNNGKLQCNTWSTEGQSDGTNFMVPFIEDWVAAGNTLSDQTISGSYTPTQNGVYKVTAWVRAINEAGGAISGAKIYVGDIESDACGGATIKNGVLGTYTAMADGKSGTPIEFGLRLKDAAINWLSFKNFTITYLGASLPQADVDAILETVPTGNMSSKVKEALDACVNALKSDASVTNYNALAVAIANANASIADYSKLYAAIQTAGDYSVVDNKYNNLVAAIAVATNIYNNGTEETCAEAIANLNEALNAAKVYDFMYVTGTDDEPGTYIYGVSLGEWTTTGYVSTFNNEHWSGTTHDYKNQDDSNGRGWNSPTGFEIGLNQNVTLPAGNYVFKACGRKSAGAVLELVVKKGDNVIGRVANFPSSNNAKGIDKDGVTSFSGENFANNGNGFGWQWRYVAFTLEEETTINVAVSASATSGQQWVSFGDYTIQTDDEANLAMIGYNIALNNAKLALDNDAYKNVTGAELIALNEAIAFVTEGKTKTEIEEATTALQEATSAFKAAAPAYDNYIAVLTKVENLDDAGKAKFAELTESIVEKYNDNTIKAEDLADVEEYYFAAIKAQTTVGSDWSALGGTDKSAWDGATGNYATNYVEKYVEGGFEAGNILTQTITSLMPYAKYEVKFTAVANVARNLSAEYYGDGIAQVFANETVEDITVEYLSGCTPSDSKYQYTLEGYADKDGNLTFGLKNVKTGGQWYVAQFTSLKLTALPSFDATLTTVGDAAYSTMFLNFPVEIPEDVEAYYVTVDGTNATMNAIEGVIPANCGVVLKAAADVEKVTFTQTSTAATTDVTDNVLIGFVKDTEVDNGKAHYAFSYKTGDTKPAFYIPESAESDTDPTSKFTAKANKAYIELEGTPSAKLDITWGGETTGINTMDNEQLTIGNSKAYNLNGMRVSSNYKGIVLKGGKKFLQK